MSAKYLLDKDQICIKLEPGKYGVPIKEVA